MKAHVTSSVYFIRYDNEGPLPLSKEQTARERVVLERDEDIGASVDDMSVGNDDPAGVDDEARSKHAGGPW